MAENTLGTDIRNLMRGCDRATLAVSLSKQQDEEQPPYAALILIAFDMAGYPLLFISDLAEHTKALKEDPRCSLLFDGTTGRRDPLTGARVTLQGIAEKLTAQEAETAKARYINRHPSAALYASFSDFNIYRIKPTRAHLVAGFGKIHWVDWADIGLHTEDLSELVEAEEDIVSHMNEDHSDVVNLMAQKLLKQSELGWHLAGVDPDGCDLYLEGRRARYPFESLVYTAEMVRSALVKAAKLARNI